MKSFIIFFLTALIIYYGMHYLIYRSITQGLNLSSKANLTILLSLVILSLSFLWGFFTRHFLPHSFINDIGFYWLGCISILLTVLLLKDLVFFIWKNHALYLTIGALSLSLILIIISLVNVAVGYRIKTINIPVNKQTNQKNIRMIQLTDLHFTRNMSNQFPRQILKDCNELKPDFVFITGDLLDDGFTALQDKLQILKQIQSKYGIFIIPGNHEYYNGIKNLERTADYMGATLLLNKGVTIPGLVNISGITDKTALSFKMEGPNIDKATSNIDRNLPTVLLSHQPLYMKEAAKQGIELTLSGHTHAGQIPPMDLLTKFVFKYSWGLYKLDNSYIYTSCGTGIWGPPMRLTSRSELVVLEMENK